MKKVKLLCSLFAALLLSSSMWAANVAKVTISGAATEYADLHEALEAGKAAGAVIELLSNVNLTGVTWIPVGTEASPFEGTLDGKNFTITGLNVEVASSAALIGCCMGNNTVVKNVTFDGATIKATTGNYAAVVIAQWNAKSIENVTVKNSTITATGEKAAGITAGAYIECHNCTVDNCTITCTEQPGAIASYVAGTPIIGCKSLNNTIIATGSRAGGLVGKYECNDNGDTNLYKLNNNVVSNCTVTAPDMAGALASQIMGAYADYEMKNNVLDATLTATKTSPIGVLRDGQNAAFTGALAKNITGNWWTDATFANCQITYTNVAAGVESQVIDRGVAKIGDACYQTLELAVAAAEAGQTIKLIADVNTQAVVEIENKTIVLDLSGKKIEYTGESVIATGVLRVHNGASLTINDSSDPSTGKIVSGSNAYAAVAMTKAGDDKTKVATLIINAGTLEGKYYAITGNGSRPNTAITINGGTLTANEANNNMGIYHPQDGTLTINGGTITAYSAAIELRAGTLVITDGTFTATSPSFSCNAEASGSTTVGAAIAIAQHTTQVDMNITISGGTFSGVKALNESNPQGNVPDPQVALAISGGKFAGEIATADVQKFISGGIYSVEPADAYIAENYQKVDNPDPTTKDDYPWTIGVAISLTEIRDVVENGFATICWAKELVASTVQNAEVYSIIDKDASGNIVLEQVTENLVAGKPYIVKGTATGKMKAQETGVAAAEASDDNGLYGSLKANYNITADAADKYAFIANDNKYYTIQNGGTLTVATNRAYILLDEITAKTQAPGRKCIKLQTGNVNTPTELMNVNANANVNGKMILNGQFIIVKDGKMFNAQGAQL